MIIDATRMCEVLVGLPDVEVLGVVDVADAPVEVVIEQRIARPNCVVCGGPARVKARPEVTFVDPVLRTCGSAGVAQASLGVPDGVVCDWVVDR